MAMIQLSHASFEYPGVRVLDADLMLPWLIPGMGWQWGWICVAVEVVAALWLLRLLPT